MKLCPIFECWNGAILHFDVSLVITIQNKTRKTFKQVDRILTIFDVGVLREENVRADFPKKKHRIGIWSFCHCSWSYYIVIVIDTGLTFDKDCQRALRKIEILVFFSSCSLSLTMSWLHDCHNCHLNVMTSHIAIAQQVFLSPSSFMISPKLSQFRRVTIVISMWWQSARRVLLSSSSLIITRIVTNI